MIEEQSPMAKKRTIRSLNDFLINQSSFFEFCPFPLKVQRESPLFPWR